MFAGTNTLYPLAKEYKIKTAFGSDLFFPASWRPSGRDADPPQAVVRHVDILRMATRQRGTPRPVGTAQSLSGKTGGGGEGSLADLLVVNGDPVADITLLEKPDTSLALIMKGGRVFKNALG